MTYRRTQLAWAGGALLIWGLARSELLPVEHWLGRVLMQSAHTLELLATSVGLALGLGWTLGTAAALGPSGLGRAVRRLHELSAVAPVVLVLGLLSEAAPELSMAQLGALFGLLKAFAAARLCLSLTSRARERPYAQAAVRLGVSNARAYARHVWPSVSPSLSHTAMEIAMQALALDGCLRLLALGAPGSASWGGAVGALLREPNASFGQWLLPLAGVALTAYAVAILTQGKSPRGYRRLVGAQQHVSILALPTKFQ